MMDKQNILARLALGLLIFVVGALLYILSETVRENIGMSKLKYYSIVVGGLTIAYLLTFIIMP